MRHASAALAAISCLAGILADAPAKADVFDFIFGGAPCVNGSPPCASGTFMTGGAAPAFGFELITGLTFSRLQVDENGAQTNLRTEKIQGGAAFNPKTGAFINSSTPPFDNIGVIELIGTEGLIFIDGSSFAQSSHLLSGAFAGGQPFIIEAPLVITPQETATPVPEASIWAMLLLGFAGLGYVGYRRRVALTRARSTPPQASIVGVDC